MNNVQNECLSEKKQEVKIKNTVLFFYCEQVIIVVTERNKSNRKVDYHEHRRILPSIHR